MASSSTFPTSLDNAGDLRALIPSDALPAGFLDWARLVSDGLTKVQTLLGITTVPKGHPRPYCEVSDTAVSLPSNANTVILTSSVESVDTHGYHSDVTNPSRFTVPAGLGGLHAFFARPSFATNATGHRRINVLVNGGTAQTIFQINAVDTAGATTVNTVFWMGMLSAGDYLEMSALQIQSPTAVLNISVGQASITQLSP